MEQQRDEEISARVERLLTAQPTAPPEARRVRRRFPVVGTRTESPRYVAIEVEVDAEFARAYRRPGQYVTLKLDGWPPRFYVVASRPRDDRWEFLVDLQGELGPVLSELEIGDDVFVSLPEGAGFDPTEAVGRPVALFCTGSGLASMRPLVEHWLTGSDRERPASVDLFYGERRPVDFCLDEVVSDWEDRGVRVHRAAEHDDSGTCRHRYVQDAFDADPPEMQGGYAYLSGAPVMTQIVAEKMLNVGVMPSHIKVNI